MLLIGEAVPAVIGFALCGLGIANAVPLLFSAAGRLDPPGPSLAAAFTVGYTGFIVGPPVIGFLADQIGLPQTLSLLVARRARGRGARRPRHGSQAADRAADRALPKADAVPQSRWRTTAPGRAPVGVPSSGRKKTRAYRPRARARARARAGAGAGARARGRHGHGPWARPRQGGHVSDPRRSPCPRRRRVEQHEVGSLARLDPAAVGKAEAVGGTGGQAGDGLLDAGSALRGSTNRPRNLGAVP